MKSSPKPFFFIKAWISGLDFLNPEKMKINSFHILTTQSQGTHSVILIGD